MKNIRSNGFTLIELMITVAIMAVLAAIATPAFNSFILSNRISAQVNDIVSAVNLARSEAVKRGNGVSICQSSDGATCGTVWNWATGWIVFSDPNVNAVVNTGEEVIHVFPALTGGTTAVFSGNTKSITFLGVGRAIGSFAGTFATVCPPAGGIIVDISALIHRGDPVSIRRRSTQLMLSAENRGEDETTFPKRLFHD